MLPGLDSHSMHRRVSEHIGPDKLQKYRSLQSAAPDGGSGRKNQRDRIQGQTCLVILLLVTIMIMALFGVAVLRRLQGVASIGVSVLVIFRGSNDEDVRRAQSLLRIFDRSFGPNITVDRLLFAVVNSGSHLLKDDLRNSIAKLPQTVDVDVLDLSSSHMDGATDLHVINEVLLRKQMLETPDGRIVEIGRQSKAVLLLPSNAALLKDSSGELTELQWLVDGVTAIGSGTSLVGTTVFYSDSNVIHSAGMDLALRQNELPTYYQRFHGHVAGYWPAIQPARVSCVPLSGMMVELDTFRSLGGLKESLGDEYATYDFCARVLQIGSSIAYVPHSTRDVRVVIGDAIPDLQKNQQQHSHNLIDWASFLERIDSEAHDDAEHTSDMDMEKDRDRFLNEWSMHLTHTVQRNWVLKSRVAWEFGAGGCAGWFIEASNFCVALEKHLPLRIITGAHDMCDGLPLDVFESLNRMLQREFEPIDIWISHKPPDRYPAFPYMGAKHVATRPRYIVGRSMYESVDIPAHWPDLCNSDEVVDEIWVPSKFLVDAFANAGVHRDRIRHVPEGIDVHFFDPHIVQPMSLPRAKNFNFLSIAKWEHRKGIDLLLEAYFREFSAMDDVNLYLVTYLYMDFDPRNPDAVWTNILQIANRLGLERNELPSIHVVTDVISTTDMPSLYAAADAFVLPTRGEGWGLPMMEAMAMELPTIAPRFGGQLDFMNDDNSFLIDVEGLEKVETAGEFTETFARPSLSHLRHTMRFVSQRPEDALQRGKRARQHVAKHFSREAIGRRVILELQRIERKLSSL